MAANLEAVRIRLAAACKAAGRDPGQVQLLAVSKARPAELIRRTAQAGQRHFGENYLQEALEKIRSLTELDLCWHFIGAIQSNKTTAIARHFDWVHSLANARHARRLSAQRPANAAPLNLCVQVNISGEAGKSGVSPEQVAPLADEIAALPGLRLRGLMCIPAPSADFTLQRQPFTLMGRLLTELTARHPQLDTLSMGMSDDFPAAIAAGATWVRLGTALFGPRDA